MTPITRHRNNPSSTLRLPIYRSQKLLDLYNDPCFSNTDTLTPSETGIPTDEEKEMEHSNIPFFIIDQQDLSAALSAAQNALTTGSTTDISIPVPNASNTVISADVYSRLYKADYHAPDTLIRFFGPMDDMLGCPYVMDTTDNDYLATHRDTLPLSEDDLEKLLWEYECTAKEHLPDLQLNVSTIPEYKDFLGFVPSTSIINTWSTASHVYDHWKVKRIQHNGKPIIPALAICTITNNKTDDPYLCFKRRGKPSSRTSMEAAQSLSGIQVNMAKARHLLAKVIRREIMRKEKVVLGHNIFSTTIQAYHQQKALGIKNDPTLERILSPQNQHPAPHDDLTSQSAQVIVLIDNLLVNNQLLLRQQQDETYENVSVCLYEPSTQPMQDRFFQQLSLLQQNHRQNNLPHPADASRIKYRSRIGRGGRRLLDRVHSRSGEPSASSTPLDDETDTLDIDVA
ncbi:hypothetical protein [Absidia glauca]|uniref:Uncharacterized protein n=1 Tax=Absidia glauca TaxID=4829 RepID=A0A168Q6A7_ABSGL|nr:hypothetical protein [Absidia glauca]